MDRIEVNCKTGEYTIVPLSQDELEAIANIPPPPPPVYSCNPWQIRKVLNQLGLRQAVEDAVAASTDQTMKDGWEFATEFRSDDPFVQSMGAALGKTQEEIKQLIQLATTL